MKPGDMLGAPHACESCQKLCEDAKEKVTKLEKRLHNLTITCTVAVTLLGQELAKQVIDYVRSFKEAAGEVVPAKPAPSSGASAGYRGPGFRGQNGPLGSRYMPPYYGDQDAYDTSRELRMAGPAGAAYKAPELDLVTLQASPKSYASQTYASVMRPQEMPVTGSLANNIGDLSDILGQTGTIEVKLSQSDPWPVAQEAPRSWSIPAPDALLVLAMGGALGGSRSRY